MKRIIVGLGNPGEKYINTRHNAGFIYLDALADELGLEWKFEKKFNAYVADHIHYILVKPQTFMNLSGTAVKAILGYFGGEIDHLLVVHDDLDLEACTYKFQHERGSAGHRGVQDIIEKLGTNAFWRLRIGVGRPEELKMDEEAYVLSKLSSEEIDYIGSLTEIIK